MTRLKGLLRRLSVIVCAPLLGVVFALGMIAAAIMEDEEDG